MTGCVSPRHELRPFVVDAPRPGMRGHALRLREVLGSRELLAFLAWRDLTVRYKQSAIGVLWAVLQPLLLVGVFTLFFGKLGRLDTGDTSYALATFTALLPWQLVAFGVFAASNSVVSSQDLVKRVYFPRILIPLAPFGVALVGLRRSFAVALVWLAFASPPLTSRSCGAGLPPSRARDRGRGRLLARGSQRPLPRCPGGGAGAHPAVVLLHASWPYPSSIVPERWQRHTRPIRW